jgi:hypothetical protein
MQNYMDHMQDPGHDWNEGEPDHEGEMAVSQLHRIAEMAEMLLDIIGENDELPGWVQYKLGRAYSDMSDLFGYIESKSHDLHDGDLSYHDDGMMSTDIDDESMTEGKKRKKKPKGLWANIRARRKAGKPRLKPGQKGYPKTLDI